MSLMDRNAEISPSMQRWFGQSLGMLLVILAFSMRHSGWIGVTLATLGAGLTIVYYVIPKTQQPIIRAWQTITFPLAWLVGHLLLLCIFFAVVLPIGLILRICRYDPLQLKVERRDSQWIERDPHRPIKSYFKQF
jgi:cytochrome b561